GTQSAAAPGARGRPWRGGTTSCWNVGPGGFILAEILARRKLEKGAGIRPLKGRVAVCHQRKVRCGCFTGRQEDSPLRKRLDGIQPSPSARERLRAGLRDAGRVCGRDEKTPPAG